MRVLRWAGQGRLCSQSCDLGGSSRKGAQLLDRSVRLWLFRVWRCVFPLPAGIWVFWSM